MRQCDCHNYKGDLCAEGEHGEMVHLETESKVGEETLCSLLRQHTLVRDMKTAKEGRKKERKKDM